MLAQKRKKLIIIITTSVIALIAIIATLIILYIKTDMFKPNSKLFAKYIVQNIEYIDNILKSEPSEIEQTIEQNKITSNLKSTIEYIDNNNDSENSINKAELDITGQSDQTSQYRYEDIRLAYENEDIAKMEYIQNEDLYGIRPDGIKQFVTIKNENIDELTLKTGLSKEDIALLTTIFNQTKISSFINFTPNEVEVLTSTYLSILTQNTNKTNFEKKSGQKIMVNGKSVDATGYALKLSKEQFNNLIIKMLERISNDEIILGKVDNLQTTLENYKIKIDEEKSLRTLFTEKIKEQIEEIENNNIGQEETQIIVYVNNGQTVKTEVKIPDNELTIDLFGEGKSAMQFTNVVTLDNKTKQTDLTLQNTTTPTTQEMQIKYMLQDGGEETNTLDLQISRNIQDKKINNTYGLRYYLEGNEAKIKVNQYLTPVNEFENKIELVTGENNYTLNELEQSNAQAIINIINSNYNEQIEKILERIKLEDINKMLKDLGILKESEIQFKKEEEEVVTEAERTRFNSELSLFLGKEVEADSIKQLLEVTNETLENAQIIYDEESTRTPKPLKAFIINIKREAGNEQQKQELLKVLEENKNEKFTITMTSDENTKLINKITIMSNKYIEGNQ